MNKLLKVVLLLFGMVIISVVILAIILLIVVHVLLNRNQKHLVETKARIMSHYNTHQLLPGLTYKSATWNDEQVDSHPHWEYVYSFQGDATAVSNQLQSRWTQDGCRAKVFSEMDANLPDVAAYCPKQNLYMDAGFYDISAHKLRITASEETLTLHEAHV